MKCRRKLDSPAHPGGTHSVASSRATAAPVALQVTLHPPRWHGSWPRNLTFCWLAGGLAGRERPPRPGIHSPGGRGGPGLPCRHPWLTGMHPAWVGRALRHQRPAPDGSLMGWLATCMAARLVVGGALVCRAAAGEPPAPGGRRAGAGTDDCGRHACRALYTKLLCRCPLGDDFPADVFLRCFCWESLSQPLLPTAASTPAVQVSVDVPWSPHGIDGRNYDWPGLAAATDLLLVMAYDMQSQAG